MSGLIEAALDGGFETPLWGGFLDGLRQATGADYALLAYQAPGAPLEEAILCFSGAARPEDVQQTFHERVYPLARSYTGPPMPDGRPFGLFDLQLHGERMNRDLALPYGLTAVRGVRITEATGVGGSLMICRRGPDFPSKADALLEALAPVLRGSLRSYVALERERFTASLATEAVRRLHSGWIALDAIGRVLEADAAAQSILEDARVLYRRPDGELGVHDAARERELRAAIRLLAEQPRSRPRAIRLCRDPSVDILLTAAHRRPMSAKLQPKVVAFVHVDGWNRANSGDHLAELFGLTPRETELAVALSEGMTIAETAREFGITVKTARGYTKIIYAKMGARGLPDLVRLVTRSVISFSPPP